MHKEGRVMEEVDSLLTDRNQSDECDLVECPEGTYVNKYAFLMSQTCF